MHHAVSRIKNVCAILVKTYIFSTLNSYMTGLRKLILPFRFVATTNKTLELGT